MHLSKVINSPFFFGYRTRRLPVYYVFGKNELSVDSFMDQMKSSSVLTKNDSILILYDVAYEYAMADLGSKLRDEGFKAVVSTLSRANIDDVVKKSTDSTSNVNSTQPTEPSSAHEFSGRKYTLLPGTSISDYKILFVGSPEVVTLNNIAVTFNRNEVSVSVYFYSFGTNEWISCSPSIRKQMYSEKKA